MPATIAPRVLVVDDDPAWIELIGRALLEVAPAAVVLSAPGGDAALERVAAEPVDLVLLDLDMPGVDGRQVLERLAAGERSPSVVVLSGSSRGPDVELCRSMASSHVAKPERMEDLVSLLRRIVTPGAPEPVPPTRVVVVGPLSVPVEGLQVRRVPSPEALVHGDLAVWADCAIVATAADAAAVGTSTDLPVVLVADGAPDAVPGAHDVLSDAELDAASLRRAIRHAAERAAFDELLVHQAQHDPLTGLPNRSLLVERLDAALAASSVHDTVVGVCVVDVDGIDRVNDRYGRQAGDQLLVAVADRLRAAVRPNDTVARTGGTHFGICCDSLDDAGVADAVARRVAWALRAPVEVAADGDVTTVSIDAAVGVATTDALPAAAGAEALLRSARGAVAVLDDERRADGARTHDLAEELERFAYAVSHDIRSPLASLRSLLELLEGEYGGVLEGDGRAWIDLMRVGIDRMAGVAAGLGAYHEAGATRPAAVPVELQGVVREVLESLAERIRATGATVSVSRLPVVVGDPAVLRDLLVRVVDNALTFTPAGAEPTVRISAEPAGDRVVLRVDDAGIGIPPEQREGVLELFRRLHPQDAYPGSGAGLAVARRLAHASGGDVWLEANPAGTGCRACVALPSA